MRKIINRRIADVVERAVQTVNQPKTSKGLTSEIAIRQRTFDFIGTLLGGLPNPDPVLKAMNKTIEVYEALLYDSRVSACVQSRKSAVKNMEWEIVGEESSEAEIEFHKEYIERFKLEDIFCQVLEAWEFGYKPMEIIWSGEAGRVIPVDFVGKPSRWFVYGENNELRFLDRGDIINGKEVPPNKFIVARNEPSYDNPYGRSELSATYWPVLFRRNGLKFFTIYVEKFGMPFLTAKAPDGEQEEKIQKMADTLADMIQDAVAVVPNAYELDTLEAKANSSTNNPVHKVYLDVMNTEICMSILGTNLTTEVQGGSFAAAQTHMEVRDDIIEGDKKIVEGAFNELIAITHSFNFAEGSTPPKFKMNAEEKVEETRALRDTQLTNQGLRFTEEYYQNKYNLTEDDFTLTEPTGSVVPVEPEEVE